MKKDSPLTVAGAAAELGAFPAPHSLLIPNEGTVSDHGRSPPRSESIPTCRPHWTSAPFLPHEHQCLNRLPAVGIFNGSVYGGAMLVETLNALTVELKWVAGQVQP